MNAPVPDPTLGGPHIPGMGEVRSTPPCMPSLGEPCGDCHRCTAPSTPTRLAEIEGRLAAAAPGPWEGADYEVLATDIDIADCQTLADADLIAHAPADLAALLAFAKEVRAAIRNPFGNAQADFTDITAALDRLEAS